MKRDFIGMGRLLSTNRSTAYPNRQLFLDVESRVYQDHPYNRHVFRLGWTRYILDTGRTRDSTDQWKLWRDVPELNAYINRCTAERNTLMIYGHNLYYDLQVIGFFRAFAALGWKLDFIYDKGLTFILVIRRGKRAIKCISTTNYFDYSLAVLAESMGMKKIELDPLTARDEELIPYCKTDVAILAEAVKRYRDFNKAHDTGKFSYTRASQAFNCYRHRFMDYKIELHRDVRLRALERDAYFGGRTESFYHGRVPGGPFTFLDVNSMYPYVMREYRYPSRALEYIEDAQVDYVKRRLPYMAMVADISLETRVPMFAYRGKDKLLFPVGRFRTCVCTEGLRRAIDRCIVYKIHRLALYECRPLFRSYVDYWYPLKARYKEEGNEIYMRIVKLFLNSLYGKFGQKRPKEDKHDNPAMIEPCRIEEHDVATGLHWLRTGMFGKEILSYGETDTRNTFTAIAAHVTEYARFTLWDIFTRLGFQRVLYCDTDSVVLRSADLDHVGELIEPKRLGALNIDRHTERLVLYNPKDYSTDSGRKTKGIPKSATQVSDHTWRYEQFQGLATHQRERVSEGFISRETQKSVSIEYDKGIVLPDGQIVPYLLDSL